MTTVDGVRGRLMGTHCAGCRTEFVDEDVPVYFGPHAPLQAAGFTMRCRYCRELRPPNPGVPTRRSRRGR